MYYMSDMLLYNRMAYFCDHCVESFSLQSSGYLAMHRYRVGVASFVNRTSCTSKKSFYIGFLYKELTESNEHIYPTMKQRCTYKNKWYQ
jgi:hypothetical protein